MAPTDRFNIVIVAPRGYEFAETFREIGETLQHGLAALGHEARLVVNVCDADAVNILLGAPLLDDDARTALPDRTIVYNFEQVHGASAWLKPPYVELVTRFPTWDYSARNIAMWRRFCPRAAVRHVPLGYVPELTRIAPAEQEDIDVLFYGAMNERRAKVLKALRQAGHNVVVLNGKFGAERDALIARAKLVVNIHYYDHAAILERPRLAYLLANRKAVVAEIDAATEADADERSAVAGVPYAELVATCQALVRDDRARRDLIERGFHYFSARSEAAILAAALGRPTTAANGNTPWPEPTTQALAPVPVDPGQPATSATDAELPRRMLFGSGRGWNLEMLNVDTTPLWGPDFVTDFRLPWADSERFDLGRFGERALPAGHFDEIHAVHVLQRVPDLTAAMTAFLRLLRDGGVLTVEVPYDLATGAWRDPGTVRSFNEATWLPFTDTSWQLGWQDYRFFVDDFQYVPSPLGQKMIAAGRPGEEVGRTPRAVDAMRLRLRKGALTAMDRERWAKRWFG